MHKCNKCGNVFDGKFCPNCGAKWEDRLVCPNCGAEAVSGARFCAECGCSLSGGGDIAAPQAETRISPSVSEEPKSEIATAVASDKKTADNSGTAIAKIYKILRYVPMVLFALYAALLFAFYAASFAGMEVSILGIYESAGSVYSMLDGLIGISVVLIMFGLIALAYAIVTVVFTFRADKKNREVKLFGKLDMTLGEAMSAVSVIIYLVFVILAGVAMGQVAGLNDGTSAMFGAEIVSGAASKLVMAFAIIFMVFAAAAIAARIVIGKKFPELWQAESAMRKQKEQERIAALPAKVEETDGEKTTVQTVKTSSNIQAGVKPLLYYAYSNKKMQLALVFAFWCMLATVVAVWVFLYLNVLDVFTLVSPHWILLIGSCVAIVAIALCLVIPVKKWSPESFRDVVSKKKKHNKGKLALKRMIAYYIVMLFLTGMTIVVSLSFGVALRGYIIAVVYGFAVSAAYIVAAVAVAKRNHALSVYLFGQPGPPPGTELIVEYDEQEQLAAYRDYKAAVKQKTALKDEKDVKKKITGRRIKFGVAAGLFAVVSVFAVVASPLLTDRFSASYVASIDRNQLDDDMLRLMFGDPHFIRATSDTSFFVEYYSDNYLDIYEQYYDLEKQMASAETDGDYSQMESLYIKMESLEQQVKTITYKYLRIEMRGYFDSYDSASNTDRKQYNYLDGGNYYFYSADVISILLDQNVCASKLGSNKSVKSVTLDGAKFLVGCDPSYGAANVEIHYTDGSYVYRPLTSDELSGVDTSTVGTKPLVWEDDYGVYRSSVSVTASVSGTCKLDDGYYPAKVKYSITATGGDGAYTYRLAFSNLTDGNMSSYYIRQADWNRYRPVIDEIYFDASIVDSSFVSGLDLKSYYIDGSRPTVTVAPGNKAYYSENGSLYTSGGMLVYSPNMYMY